MNQTRHVRIASSVALSTVALLLLLVLLGGFGAQSVAAKAALQDAEAFIEKTGPDMVSSGSEFTYTIVYSNTGTYTLTDVVITDMLPDGVSYVTDTSGLDCEVGATGTLTWSVGSVATGTGKMMFDLVVGLAEAQVDATLTNTVEISATEAMTEASWAVDVEPMVLETGPAANAGADADFSAVFNVPLDETTVNSTTFTLEDPDGGVTGTVTYSAATQTATFDPDDDLEFNALYTATLSKDVEASNGITLGEDYEWTFTPKVLKMVSPMDGATGVDVGANVEAMFNVTVTNASSATFMVEGVTGTVTYSAATQTATFDPEEDLEYETTYTATLSKDLEASTGVTLGMDYEWTFTTQAAPVPDLAITKAVMPDANVAISDVVTYTVSIANTGTGDALGVVITDMLPSEVEFGGFLDDSNGTAKLPVSDTIRWAYDVAAGADYSFIFTATIKELTLLLPVKNTACFTSTNAGAGCADAIFNKPYGIYLPLVVRNAD